MHELLWWTWCRLSLVILLLVPLDSAAIEPSPQNGQLRDDAKVAMRRAATFYREEVATHGGYVYHYSLDLQRRWGEGEATQDQIWVQPPGTPTVGLAYLTAHDATGDDYYLEAIGEVADALLYGQLHSGGWTNCIDFNPQGERVALYRNGAGGGKNYSSLDDGQSQAAISFLVRADEAFEFQNDQVRDAVEFALDSLLAAQYPIGAFPQVWSEPVEPQPILPAAFPEYDWRTAGKVKEYWHLYTLNDRLAEHVYQTLYHAYQVYGDEKFLDAIRRLGDFLVLAQLPEPQPAWAQQYTFDMHPAWARKFEPPAISGHESQGIVRLLMDIYVLTADEKYLQPLPAAIEYLRRSTLPDGRLARYYALETNRPLYMKREGDVYHLTYDDANLPTHYSWKTASQWEQLADQLKAVRGEGRTIKSVEAPSEAEVRAIIAALDAQGRWTSIGDGQRLVGSKRFAEGEPYLSSQTFADNLTILARFVGAHTTADPR